MIESVERLKKFVDEYSSSSPIYKTLTGASLTLTDLKEALSLIPPYAPGEEIEVSDFPDFRNRLTCEFIGFLPLTKKVVVFQNQILCFEYHRPIPATVDLKGFPVDAISYAENFVAGYDGEKRLTVDAEGLFSVCQAIVTSARKE